MSDANLINNSVECTDKGGASIALIRLLNIESRRIYAPTNI